MRGTGLALHAGRVSKAAQEAPNQGAVYSVHGSACSQGWTWLACRLLNC